MKLFVIITFSCLLTLQSSYAKLHLIDEISVVVNDDIVLNSDIKKLIKKDNTSSVKKYKNIPHSYTAYLVKNCILSQIESHISRKISQEDLILKIRDFYRKNKINVSSLKKNKNIIYVRFIDRMKIATVLERINTKAMHPYLNIIPKRIKILEKKIKSANINYISLSHFFFTYTKKLTRKKLKSEFHHIVKLVKKNNIKELKDKYNLAPSSMTSQNIWHCVKNPFSIRESILNSGKFSIFGPIFLQDGIHIIRINNISKSHNIESKKVDNLWRKRAYYIYINFKSFKEKNAWIKKKIEKSYIKILGNSLD